MFCPKSRQCILTIFGLFFLIGLHLIFSLAEAKSPSIDPRLVGIVEEVRTRAIPQENMKKRPLSSQSEQEVFADNRIQAAMRIQEAAYSKDPASIRKAISDFDALDTMEAVPSMARIKELYFRHAELLDLNASAAEQQNDIATFEETGSWLERYLSTQLSVQLYTETNERQSALQKAQYGFQIITNDSSQLTYSKFAKADTLMTLSQLHNMQGNVEFAINSSLEYLKVTRDEGDTNSAIDIINNLIFSHSMHRDHESLLYLSEQLLEIEKSSTSSILGLSENRIAQAAIMSGNFQMGLDYTTLAMEKSQHPQVSKSALINHAVSLAGLGRETEAKKLMLDAGINLGADHLLNSQTNRDIIYLGFLLAQGRDNALATQLYNRQLDVTAQKFLANNSRDTTAMVAELENSRERQAERDAAAAREARLQAITIDRQRMLNRTLIVLSALLGCAALASFLFTQFRMRIVGELEEKTIEAASAEKLKTEFLGMISHELRTPLNGIIGISDVLANYHEDPDIREKTAIVLQSGQDLLSVVESLTDMARLDAGQLVLVPYDTDLASALAAVPEMWTEPAQEKGLNFTHFLDPSISHHYIDEDRLVQCLNILLSNAVRFTLSGRVHLHITVHQDAKTQETALTAIVADTGQGMSELVQSRLFTPFMQADTSRKRTHMGTGLSLAIAYGIAEMMDGALTVVSREGRGSEFKLTIPLRPAQAAPSEILEKLTDTRDPAVPMEAKASIEPPAALVSSFSDIPVLESAAAPQRVVRDLMQPRNGRPGLHDTASPHVPQASQDPSQHILIIGGSGSVLDSLKPALQSHGHRYSLASDGLSALVLLDQTNFDLVLLDRDAPLLDGAGTLQRIRAASGAYANIPVVVLSADNAPGAAACMEAGADIFLKKPVRDDELLRTIRYFQRSENRAYNRA